MDISHLKHMSHFIYWYFHNNFLNERETPNTGLPNSKHSKQQRSSSPYPSEHPGTDNPTRLLLEVCLFFTFIRYQLRRCSLMDFWVSESPRETPKHENIFMTDRFHKGGKGRGGKGEKQRREAKSGPLRPLKNLPFFLFIIWCTT